jgi:hypothetical protein
MSLTEEEQFQKAIEESLKIQINQKLNHDLIFCNSKINFSHCSSCSSNFFHFCLKKCPICLQEIILDPMNILNSKLSENAQPRSILVKCTSGTMKDYNRTKLLHVGISSSKGMVCNFDENGHKSDKTGWEWCLNIQLPQEPVEKDRLTDIEWDTILEDFTNKRLFFVIKIKSEERNPISFPQSKLFFICC